MSDKGAETLLIRADANVAMGTGHVMRCLALAQAWHDAGGRCMFAMAESTPAVERWLGEERIEIEHIEHLEAPAGTAGDAKQTRDIAGNKNAVWIVVDGYQFGADYQSAIKQSASKLLFVDDNGHAERYCADLVLNQNSHANESLYVTREAHTRLLLGPRYAMLRREFRLWKDWSREIPETATKILIAMGGSDPENFTRRVVEALEGVREFPLEILAVVGGSNPHLAEIEDAISRSPYSIRLVRDATDMPDLMAWADMAISAAGSICWEFCALALPAILIPIAPNQDSAADSLQRLGAAKLFSGAKQFCPKELAREVVGLITSPYERRSLSQRAHALVDAQGACRVVAELSSQPADRRRNP